MKKLINKWTRIMLKDCTMYYAYRDACVSWMWENGEYL